MSFFAPDAEFFERVQIKPARRIAFVGKRDGTITTDREYYIYVRANSLVGPEYQVYDPGKIAPRTPGVVVEVVEREGAAGRFEIKGFAGSTPPSVIAKTTGSQSQQYGGADQLIIDQRQLKQGTMHQTNPASMKVTINAFTIEEGPTRHSVSTQTTGTITAPGAGLARWDTVSIDPFDFSLTVTTGTPYNKNFPEAGVKPAQPTSEILFGNITLNDGTTSLLDGRNISPSPPYFQMPDNLITAIGSSVNTSGPGVYKVDTSGGAITLTLDTDDAVAGRRIFVNDVTGDGETNNITIATEGAETINGAASITMFMNYDSAELYSDGTNWFADEDLDWLFEKMRVGTPPDYLNINNEGHLTLEGDATVWDDHLVPLTTTKLAGVRDPDYAKVIDDGAGSTGVRAFFFDKNLEEEADFIAQFPHKWKEGSTIYPHMHWLPSDVDTGVVRWGLEYTWASIGATFGNTTLITGDGAGTGTALDHIFTEIGSGIDATGKTHSSILLGRVYRDAGADNYNADAIGLEIDFHIEINQIGDNVKPGDFLLLLETGDNLLLETGDELLLE